MRSAVVELDAGMQEVVEQYLPLAASIANTIYQSAPHALELDEVRATAYLGLVKAAARWPDYCEERGFSPADMQYFATFAGRRIRGEVIDSFRKRDFATRGVRDRMKVLIDAGLDQGKSVAELAAITDMTEQEIRAAIAASNRRPVSLEAAGDMADESSVESDHSMTALMEKMVRYIQTLPVIAQVVLSLHYYRGMELREIAAELQITESRASQLHTSAVLGIRDLLSSYLKV